MIHTACETNVFHRLIRSFGVHKLFYSENSIVFKMPRSSIKVAATTATTSKRKMCSTFLTYESIQEAVNKLRTLRIMIVWLGEFLLWLDCNYR